MISNQQRQPSSQQYQLYLHTQEQINQKIKEFKEEVQKVEVNQFRTSIIKKKQKISYQQVDLQDNLQENLPLKSAIPSKNTPIQKKQLYQWLEVKSNYDYLKVRLKKILIENINQLQNQELINYFIARQNHQPQFEIDSQKQKRITQKNKLILHFNKNNTKLFHKTVQWTQQQQNKYKNILENKKKLYSHGLPPKLCSQNRYNRIRALSPKSLTSVSMQLCSSKVQNQSSLRPQLLQKYFNNQYITQQQFKLLIRTSPILNKCIDKQFIKTAVSNLDKETIQNMELEIAEQVRKNWGDKKKQMTHQRNKLIKKQIQVSKQKINLWSCKQEQKKQINDVLQENKNLKKMYLNKIKSMATFSQLNKNKIPKGSPIPSWPFSPYQSHPTTPIYLTQGEDPSQVLTKNQNQFLSHFKKNVRIQSKHELVADTKMKRFLSGGPKKNGKSINDNKVKKIQRICRKYIKIISYVKKSELQKQIHCKKFSGKNFGTKQSNALLFAQQIALKINDRIQTGYASQRQYDSPLKNKNNQTLEHECINKTTKRKGITQKSTKRKLFLCIKKGNINQLRAINSMFTDNQINCFDQNRRTPLYVAAMLQKYQICNQLLKSGAQTNIRCLNSIISLSDQTPVHIAFNTNNIDLIRQFIYHGGDLNLLDDDGLSPLAYARLQVLKKLNLQKGVAKGSPSDNFDNNKIFRYPEVQKIKQHSNQLDI